MFMIDYVTPDKAEGAVKAIYSIFPAEMPVPDPIQLFSASPRYLTKQMEIAGALMQDDAFESSLLAALRYIGASTACFGFCTEFNKGMLTSMGLTEEEINALASEPSKAFEEKDAALLSFVAKSISTPDAVNQADIDATRKAGWSDQHIFEATAYAAQMATLGIVFRTFAAK
ncbi:MULTISPECIES: hypothetical protein [unclassified Pseudodesulfovibrio]|uniref:carboxymuconolactone decarboxylase family protein n=1 Tax=unclassified Pseudodesulfovibrio TaxID=2661612 RepID=UPI000FEC050E|nr:MULTISPECIES: hypothetical protein [unclassified Pseudodesulfovibrio]MCJ2164197.1 hypothetical protein [Pseudodesulfovibrio sp. S3-i]RWU05179.1 hypothetical protein DWB63_05855 [Pseudodesulfovibrio sp. S3]